MKLLINTSQRDSFQISLGEKSFTSESHEQKSQLLLPFILEKMEENNMSFTDITEIELYTENGSFTGLRVGASIAQALAWALSIPINGEKIDKLGYVKLNYKPSELLDTN